MCSILAVPMKSPFNEALPMLRPLIYLSLGIFFAYKFIDEPPNLMVVIILWLLLLLIYKFQRNRYIQSTILFSLLFIAGISLFSISQYNRKPTLSDYNYLLAEVIQTNLKPDKTVCVCNIKAETNLRTIRTSLVGKVLISFPYSVKSKKIIPGELLLFNATKLREPDGALNPGAFNYKEWLRLKGIFFLSNLNAQDYKLVKENTTILDNLNYNITDYIHELFFKSLSIETYGVAEALVYGNDDLIPKHIINDYATTGTLHVLAVSGMHVGMIYLLLNVFLTFLGLRGDRVLLKLIILLSLLWTYSFLCGSSPSILRATIMFSLLIIGKYLRINSGMLNNLCSSAFIIISINPCLLFDSGLLLSYGAVAGIVIYHPVVNNFYTPRKFLSKQIWQIISISIAAQIGTLPLSLSMFHTFPIYFIPANLLIIPISTIILYLCLVMIGISFSAGILTFFIPICNNLIQFMNSIAERIASLPHATLCNINPDSFQMILGFVFFLKVLRWINTTHKSYLKHAFICLVCITADSCIYKLIDINEKTLIIYHSRKGIPIEFKAGNKSILLTDSFGKIDYLRTNQSQLILREVKLENHAYRIRAPFISCFIEGKPNFKNEIKEDLIILRNNSKSQIEDYRTAIIPGMIHSKTSYNFHTYYLSTSGAFQLNLNQ